MDSEVLVRYSQNVRLIRLYVSAVLSIVLALVGTFMQVWFLVSMFLTASVLLVPFALAQVKVVGRWATSRADRLFRAPRLLRVSLTLSAMALELVFIWYLGARFGAGAAAGAGLPLLATEVYLACEIAYSRKSKA